jgi:hypothetical protein
MKKSVLFLLAAVSLVSAVCFILSCFAPQGRIAVINSSSDPRKAEINNELYCISNSGVYKVGENSERQCLIPFNGQDIKAFFSGDKNSICICKTTENGTEVSRYDLNGDLSAAPILINFPDVDIYAEENGVFYGIFSVGENIEPAAFDSSGERTDTDIKKLEYTDDVFTFLGDRDRKYYALIIDTASKYIGRSKDRVIYLKRSYSPELIIADPDTDSIIRVDLADKFRACHSFSNVSGDCVCTVLSATHSTVGLGSGHSDKGDISSLKKHSYDIYVLTDINSGEVIKQHKTRRGEKIIYADTEKVMTIYRGRYITYSAEDWKKLDLRKAPEIKKDGSYTFETCGEHIFVFDDDTGRCINKLSVP